MGILVNDNAWESKIPTMQVYPKRHFKPSYNIFMKNLDKYTLQVKMEMYFNVLYSYCYVVFIVSVLNCTEFGRYFTTVCPHFKTFLQL